MQGTNIHLPLFIRGATDLFRNGLALKQQGSFPISGCHELSVSAIWYIIIAKVYFSYFY